MYKRHKRRKVIRHPAKLALALVLLAGPVVGISIIKQDSQGADVIDAPGDEPFYVMS